MAPFITPPINATLPASVRASEAVPAASAILPSLLPAFARLPARLGLPHAVPGRAEQPTAAAALPTTGLPAPRQPVRIYRGPARFIMVGKISEICRMIDRCIADENAGRHTGLFY